MRSRSKLSLLVAVGIVWIFVGLPVSTVRAAQPSVELGACFAVAEFTFREAVDAMATACDLIADGDRLLVTMCFPAQPPDDRGGPQSVCPDCDLSTQWALSCSVLSFGKP